MNDRDADEAPDAVPELVQRTKGVDSARRALQILLQFTESRPELTIDNVLEAHGISVPSAYRYLSLLREMNLIEERGKGTFVLTPRVLRLARSAEVSLDYRTTAQPILDRMREETGETALYIRRVNDAAVCLAIAESDHQISISFQPGHLMPLHLGAAPKVLLAEYSDAKREQYFDWLRPPMSKADRSKWDADLDSIRATGYAQSTAEVDAGVWAAAAGVRSYGALVGALTVVAPAFRLSEADRQKIGAVVRAGAAEFEAALGQ
ncbi:MAG: IclR family transcriptional regulator [Naasia sp.]|jgi:DNA-binding IclR family transcriptional regulator|uniref:IclR family transcriptional regulator n=1 Tax=Naasia sp. TaxID=2546198 RepID=UPI00260E4D2F|nr:IclR family transcriptional regulator [Naasia sp.]MCU1570439.1 IclR family transcriptional regulator [Naasia sp.]